MTFLQFGVATYEVPKANLGLGSAWFQISGAALRCVWAATTSGYPCAPIVF